MKYFRIVLGVMVLLLISKPHLYAQEEEVQDTVRGEEVFSLIRESPVTLNLEREEALADDDEDKKDKKKKRKKKVFYGIKTRRGFVRSGQGERTVLETFYYLKVPQDPVPFVPEIFYYDTKQRRLRSTAGDFDPERGKILHGPYRKSIGDQVVEEGIYYLGAKHGRWMAYDKNNILLDKKKYYMGWPKESLVKYYDNERTKLKEIIPIVYGEKEGTYYYFHENGTIAIRGEYSEGEKVGKWTEFYDFRNRKKKEIQFPIKAGEDAYDSYIAREWNRRGQLVYEKKLFE